MYWLPKRPVFALTPEDQAFDCIRDVWRSSGLNKNTVILFADLHLRWFKYALAHPEPGLAEHSS